MLEFEKKSMLWEDEYRFLKEHRYSSGKATFQINHYYDTDSFELDHQGITCRIREKNGICIATVKEHHLKGSDCSTETSRIVKNRYDDTFFRNMDIRYQGSLETTRSVYYGRRGITILLDKNCYLGTVDYEMEIEYDLDHEALALAELDSVISDLTESGILKDPSEFKSRICHSRNKASRFFSRKAEIREKIKRWMT